jgi:ubiquinone/menaquinone biosynthesis C-methylase UbiE
MIILVVGMHRSGTSMVARGLHAMGANLGERIDVEPHPHNPHGHWEHADVWRTQEELLIRFGREWHSAPGPLPQRWLEWPDTIAAMATFAGIARSEIARCGHWVVKDPRSSLLIPLWREVAARVGCHLRILRIRRDAAQVAMSLLDRNGMPHEHALRIWHDHQRSIDMDASGLMMLEFDHAQIMRDPHSAFASMGRFCGLPDAESRSASAAALVDPALWHHREAAPEHTGPRPTASDASAGDAVPPSGGAGQVAIIMRTRWRLHMIPRAVRSVLSQTHSNWFLQIVNDGGPPHIVEEDVAPYRHLCEGRLGVLHLPKQLGMEAATNAGIAASPGEFIAIHDDDDTWHPDFLERMLAWMRRDGHAAAVCRSVIIREAWDGQRYVTRSAEEFGPWSDSISGSDLVSRNHFPPISLLFRRSEYREVGPFHEGLPALGDWHFNKRLASRRPIPVLAETLAQWRLRDPKDCAPNSPEGAHWRSHRFVAEWPREAPLPEYFSQVKQVRIRSLASLESRFPQRESDAAGWADMDRVGEPLLDAGIHLVHMEPDGAHGTAGAVGGSRPYFCARIGGDRVEPIPLGPESGDGVTMLINARQPVRAMGLFDPDGRTIPIRAPVRTFRLAEPLASLEAFAGAPRLPDVLCIGAQRAGTTWLHQALQCLPGVWTCGIKEFHHFDWDGTDGEVASFRLSMSLARILELQDSDLPKTQRESAMRMYLRHGLTPSRTWEGYAALFESAPRHTLACDFTPAYATLDDATVAEVARVMPDVKVIIMLRDPVTRALSGALHHLRGAGVETPSEDQIRAACASSENELRTDYIRTLGIWERHIPRRQLLVLFHDDIGRDPGSVLTRTCAFLGIDGPQDRGAWATVARASVNRMRHDVPWPVRARVKVELSRRWLPMLTELEARFGDPVTQWRLAAEARIAAVQASAAGAGAGQGNSVVDNLAQWDALHPWSRDGDEWTRQAEACGMPYQEWRQAMLARYVPLMQHGGVILEIGPGHGRWSEPLVEHADLLVLCDISPNCLDACRARLTGMGRIRTHVSRAADLPLDLSGSVDAVWSYDCLVHVAPPEFKQYIAEIARVLKPGGVAVLHHAHRPGSGRGLTGAVSRAARALKRVVRRTVHYDSRTGWRSPVTREDVRTWAASAGLAVERQESMWTHESARGPIRVGVPRLGDCITILRRP